MVFNILKNGVRGVDAFSDPVVITGRKLRHALNMSFSTGNPKTRPPFSVKRLGIKGNIQGSTIYNEAGISVFEFGCGTRLAFTVGGATHVIGVSGDGVVGCAVKLGEPVQDPCGETPDPCCDVNLYGAENYLVVQTKTETKWWSGSGDLVASKGMSGNPGKEDSFTGQGDQLVNGAGLGVYWNGRIHQQVRNTVFVGDIIHKRGFLSQDDILGMTEQANPSFGPPLSTNSRLGRLIAMEGLPKMGTANGEGDLIGFYEHGVVSYNTFIYPRQTKRDGEGTVIQEGWGEKQMVTHMLRVVSAVGRYSVAVLPKDLLFRSKFGIHLFSRTIGVETIHDEPSNSISDEVNNILSQDDDETMAKSSCGYWISGNRFLATCGEEQKGLVVYNKSWGFSEDDTPAPAWEGVWVPPAGKIHRVFGETATSPALLLCSDGGVSVSTLMKQGSHDWDGRLVSIPWAFLTGRFIFGTVSKKKSLSSGTLIFRRNDLKAVVTVFARGDNGQWVKWGSSSDQSDMAELKLGEIPGVESLWFDFWVQGTGSCEIISFDVDIADCGSSFDESGSHAVTDTGDPDYFSIIK